MGYCAHKRFVKCISVVVNFLNAPNSHLRISRFSGYEIFFSSFYLGFMTVEFALSSGVDLRCVTVPFMLNSDDFPCFPGTKCAGMTLTQLGLDFYLFDNWIYISSMYVSFTSCEACC
jgi:hypothetical protein